MEQELTLVRIGHSARLERLLPAALARGPREEHNPGRKTTAAGSPRGFCPPQGEKRPG